MQLCLHGKVQASDGVPHEKLLVSETKVEASFCPKHANFDEIRFNLYGTLAHVGGQESESLEERPKLSSELKSPFSLTDFWAS